MGGGEVQPREVRRDDAVNGGERSFRARRESRKFREKEANAVRQAEVYINIPVKRIAGTYSYRVPEELSNGVCSLVRGIASHRLTTFL